jgi:hypothetical protein
MNHNIVVFLENVQGEVELKLNMGLTERELTKEVLPLLLSGNGFYGKCRRLQIFLRYGFTLPCDEREDLLLEA